MPEILTQTSEGFKAILKFANEHKVPIAGSMAYTADLGSVFSYTPDTFEMGMLAAIQADRIFKGAPPVQSRLPHLRVIYGSITE
jgi:ABC-type uncharacterized transport system substrate-binding protein